VAQHPPRIRISRAAWLSPDDPELATVRAEEEADNQRLDALYAEARQLRPDLRDGAPELHILTALLDYQRQHGPLPRRDACRAVAELIGAPLRRVENLHGSLPASLRNRPGRPEKNSHA
jgi:hypothetical protein